MLRNILGLHERRIADVMVQRADIIAVKRDIPLGELMDLFESAAHSRLVVYNETLDDPEGMVHIRDLLAFMTAKRASPTPPSRAQKAVPAGLDLRAVDLALPLADANIIRKLLYVPPSMRAIDLLAQMQASRIHLALVVDEYGGTDGLVSIEDIVEQIVGEIDDEHDSDEPPAIVRQPDNSFIADARASLEDVRTLIGEEFVTGEAGEEVDTLGGYLVAMSAACRCAAKSFPAPAISRSRCSMPIRAGSSGCASDPQGAAGATHAARAKPPRPAPDAARRRPTTIRPPPAGDGAGPQ